MGCYWKYSTSSVWAASKFTLPRLRRQGEFDPVWVHVQAWRLCHWKAAASHETWTTVMEITGSADETEMTKNTRDAAHEHAAASINVMTEKRNVPLEMTKTSFTGCNFAIKCTTHLCQSNHVTSKNKHWLSLMTKWSSLSMLEHLKPWDKLKTGLESSVQLKLSLCASLPAAASCALLEGECSCRAQQLSWSRSAYTSNQNELKLRFGHSKVNHYLYWWVTSACSCSNGPVFCISNENIKHPQHPAELFKIPSWPIHHSWQHKAGCSSSLCFLNILIKQWLWI